MLKIFKVNTNLYHNFQKTLVLKRSFLSEAYRCEEAWKARHQSELLKKFSSDDLFMKLNHMYVTTKKISAVDVDIFANTVTGTHQIEELLSLLQFLRQCAETTNTLDSTHHAVVKYLLDSDNVGKLMEVLYDRLTYGIIPDNLTYNVLMDTCIKKKDYANAAKVAALPMLQEDTENPITNALSVYACFKYLENPGIWQKPPEPIDDSQEEIKVRVDYLRNPYFDDHFDLVDPYDLIGKTLAFQGKVMNNTLGRTCQLRGLILYKKYQSVSELIQQWLNELSENLVYKEVFNLIEKDNESIPKEQITADLERVMSEVNELKQQSLCMDSLMEALENNVKSAVDKQQAIDINEQIQKYSMWEKERQTILDKQIAEINRLARIENVNKIKKNLTEQERLLTFFDKEEEIEIQIEELERKDKAERERVLKMPLAEKKLRKLKKDEEYIPPTL